MKNMKDRIYRSSEVANVVSLGLSHEALSIWPAVALPEPCVAHMLDWAKGGHATEQDIDYVKRLRSGFRTKWGVVVGEIEKYGEQTSLVLQVYLADDPWLGVGLVGIYGDRDEEIRCYLSDLVASDLEAYARVEIEALSLAGAAPTDTDEMCAIAVFRGFWSDDQEAAEAIRVIGPLFAQLIRRVRVPTLIRRAAKLMMGTSHAWRIQTVWSDPAVTPEIESAA
jgi:hypothetical protein